MTSRCCTLVLRRAFSPQTCQKLNFSTPPTSVTTTTKLPSGILMKKDNEELKVAELVDYEAVMSIDPDVHASGLDSLPYHYPAYIHGPGVRGYIYKQGGRPVGFVSMQLVDGGQSIAGVAARVAPDCRGSGMLGRFSSLALSQYRWLDGLQNVVMTLEHRNKEINGRKLLKTYNSKIMDRVAKFWSTDARALRKAAIHRPVQSDLRELSHDNIQAMLCRPPELTQHLFPERMLLLGPRWCPCRIHPANFQFIMSDDRIFLASGQMSSLRLKLEYFPGTLLSSGAYFNCGRGVCYAIDFYGHGNAEELRGHIEKHIHRWVAIARKGETVLFAGYPKDLAENLQKAVASVPLTELESFRHVVLGGKYHH